MAIKEYYDTQKMYQEQMEEELIRVQAFLEDMGIRDCGRVDYAYCKRYIKVETPGTYRNYPTYFAVPQDKDMEAVVRWLIKETMFRWPTVFIEGRTATTLSSELDIKHYFKEV